MEGARCPIPVSSNVLSNSGISSMDASRDNDNTVVFRDSSRAEDCIQSSEQHAPKVYGLRNRWGWSIELAAGKIVERKLRNKGEAFRPFPDIEEGSLRSAWKHVHMSREQKIDGASTAETRCSNDQTRKLMARDAVVQVHGSEAVSLIAHSASLLGEFSDSNNVGGTRYSVEFSKPLKTREFHVDHESDAPDSDDRYNKRARKLLAQGAMSSAGSDSETVVPMQYVFLSDAVYVG